MLSLDKQHCNTGIKAGQHKDYPFWQSCGQNGCVAMPPWDMTDDDASYWKKINPVCFSWDVKDIKPCPEDYLPGDVVSTGYNSCWFGGRASVLQCNLDKTKQSVINAYDPLRAKIYSDPAKTETLNTSDPAFDINMQRLFACCSGDIDTTNTNQATFCGGYYRPLNQKCDTNCLTTIKKYCTDLDHPERLLTVGSLCNNWAGKQKDVLAVNDPKKIDDADEADASNLKYVAKTLKIMCKYDNKDNKLNNKAYSNITINDYNDSCACYRPKEFYEKFLDDVAEKLGPKAMPFAKVPNPACIWMPCKGSSLVPGSKENQTLTLISPEVGGVCGNTNIASCTTVNNANIIDSDDIDIVINDSKKCDVFVGGKHPNPQSGEGKHPTPQSGEGDDGDDDDGDGEVDPSPPDPSPPDPSPPKENKTVMIIIIIIIVFLLLLMGLGVFFLIK